MMDCGVPPTLATKSLRGHSTGSRYSARSARNSLRSGRLVTVLTLFATTLGAPFRFSPNRNPFAVPLDEFGVPLETPLLAWH
jgi:hypothetical protein